VMWDLNKHRGKPRHERPLQEPPTDKKPWWKRMPGLRRSPCGWTDFREWRQPWTRYPLEQRPCEATAAPEAIGDPV
jgi:hypothetical protein